MNSEEFVGIVLLAITEYIRVLCLTQPIFFFPRLRNANERPDVYKNVYKIQIVNADESTEVIKVLIYDVKCFFMRLQNHCILFSFLQL